MRRIDSQSVIHVMVVLLMVLPLVLSAAVQETAGQVQQGGVQPFGGRLPYACRAESGVCLCVGQDNCTQMTQPTPCKRPKLCMGETVGQQPPPQPGQITRNLLVCSCRSAP